MMETNGQCLTVHALRSRWKPHKQRLHEVQPNHPTSIRLHRAFSWMQRCEDWEDDKNRDLVLVCLWIAFNGLYGRWNADRREPESDRESWRGFLDQVLKLDADSYLQTMLNDQRTMIMSILDDEYLSSFFWEEPGNVRAGKSKKSKFDARTWYLEKKWGLLLERLVERVYLLRCQLVHGAATHGSRLNRDSLHRCIGLLRYLLNAVLLVMIDHGAQADWGQMCYPPLEGSAAARSVSQGQNT